MVLLKCVSWVPSGTSPTPTAADTTALTATHASSLPATQPYMSDDSSLLAYQDTACWQLLSVVQDQFPWAERVQHQGDSHRSRTWHSPCWANESERSECWILNISVLPSILNCLNFHQLFTSTGREDVKTTLRHITVKTCDLDPVAASLLAGCLEDLLSILHPSSATPSILALFMLYVQPPSAIANHHSLFHHSFSDDNQLYASAHLSELHQIISSSQACISDVQAWNHHTQKKQQQKTTTTKTKNKTTAVKSRQDKKWSHHS